MVRYFNIYTIRISTPNSMSLKRIATAILLFIQKVVNMPSKSKQKLNTYLTLLHHLLKRLRTTLTPIRTICYPRSAGSLVREWPSWPWGQLMMCWWNRTLCQPILDQQSDTGVAIDHSYTWNQRLASEDLSKQSSRVWFCPSESDESRRLRKIDSQPHSFELPSGTNVNSTRPTR